MTDLLYFEDLPVGATFDVGSCTVSEAEIINFARQFDPQPFHTDPAAAAHTPYGGVIASGWHTGSLAMRLMVDGLLLRSASYGSPGVDNLRFLLPVRPGDTLYVRCTVMDARRSASKPDRGLITMRSEATNQDGFVVFSMDGLILFRCRTNATA